MRRLIRDSLRYWVREMHVDGFRFDLASVLARGEVGQPLPNPPIVWDIESDPALAGVKLIAEAWDAAGLYQVGTFVGDAWQEWNGKFRDDVRSFVKSDDGYVGALIQRTTGSPDIYARDEHFYVMANAYWEPLTFTLPPERAPQGWRLWLDTSQPPPHDIYAPQDAPPVAASTYEVGPRTIVALVAMT